VKFGANQRIVGPFGGYHQEPDSFCWRDKESGSGAFCISSFFYPRTIPTLINNLRRSVEGDSPLDSHYLNYSRNS
jgi:hypothetical protein